MGNRGGSYVRAQAPWWQAVQVQNRVQGREVLRVLGRRQEVRRGPGPGGHPGGRVQAGGREVLPRLQPEADDSGQHAEAEAGRATAGRRDARADPVWALPNPQHASGLRRLVRKMWLRAQPGSGDQEADASSRQQPRILVKHPPTMPRPRRNPNNRSFGRSTWIWRTKVTRMFIKLFVNS